VSRATDETGRALRFSNANTSSGVVANYADTGALRDSQVCFVDGVRCQVREAHFGGIVVIKERA
jgi:hypothetical protein